MNSNTAEIDVNTTSRLGVSPNRTFTYSPINYSDAYVGGITALYVVIMCVSLIGYSLIFMAFYLNSRLRTICNYFILSLGVADVLVLCSVLPTSMHIMLQGVIPYGNSIVLCDFFATLNLIGTSAVAMNLSSVSIERFLAVAYPFKYELFMTKRKAWGLIASLWIYSTVTGLLPQMGWRDFTTYFSGGRCVRDMTRSYVFFLTIFNFCVPALVMVASNTAVYYIAREQAKKILQAIPLPAEHNNEKKGKCSRSESLKLNVRAAKRVSVIVGAFLVCWVPHITVLIVGLVIGHHRIPYEVYPVTLSLEYMSSAIDPCIFCFTNRDLASALKLFLWKRFPRKENGDSTEATSLENRRMLPQNGPNGSRNVEFHMT